MALFADSSLKRITKNITLPSQGSENGYLLVKTDSYNSQPETDETDNVKAVAITLTQPKDNLVVTEITAPTVALSGQSIPLAWTVQNQGIDQTTASNWIDRAVYSTDDIFGNEDDIYLTESQNRSYVLGSGWHNVGLNDNYVPLLNPNETYTIINRSFFFLPSEIDNGYLLVKTDVNNNQVETDETDNIKVVPITIARRVSTDNTNNNAPTVTNPITVTEDFSLTTIGGSITGTSGLNHMIFGTQTLDGVLFTAGGSLAGGEGDDTFSTLNPNLPVKGIQYA